MPPSDEPFLRSAVLLFVLLNPFLMTIYLLDLVQELDARTFRSVLVRACAISAVVFAVFAVAGEHVFEDVLQVRFASFLIFGGLVFLWIGLRFVFEGQKVLAGMRGRPAHIAGSIALPFMIGPGTVSASVLAGVRLEPVPAVGAITLALAASAACLVALKALHDRVRQDHAELVERYVDIVGRLSALLVGTIAIEMILRGIELWRADLVPPM